jgi:(E)-4-hydroxy-3-methylbut-2-enyl-diphosphate synthase
MTVELEQNKDYSKLPYTLDAYAYTRRKTRVVKVGEVGVGGNNPIRLQSMTTADTMDTDSVVAETIRLVNVGCEIVRITTPTAKDAENLKNIRVALTAKGIYVPLVADVHFNPNAAMEAAKWADKVRINPGNFADAKRFAVREYTDVEYQKELNRIEEKFAPLVLFCKEQGRSMRIGTNHGSLSDRIMNYFGDTPEGMVESALEYTRIARKYDYHDIIFSMKASNPKVMIQAYRLLVARLDELGWDYPLHLGVTEAGNGEDGRIKSAIGIGSLLEDGLGDTIRVSLTEDPEYEIPVAARIARRYTPLDKTILEKAGILNETPAELPVKFEDIDKELEPYDYGKLYPDFRDPYHYNKVPSEVVTIGTVNIGGDNLPAVIGWLTDEHMKEMQKSKRSLPLLGGKKASVGAPTTPDIYLIGDAQLTDEMKNLKTANKLALVCFVSDMDKKIAEKAINWGVDGLYLEILPEYENDELKKIAQLAVSANTPLFLVSGLFATSGDYHANHRAGEINAEVSYLCDALEQVTDLGMKQLIVGFYSGNAAMNARANRLLVARMQQRGWKYPLHLVSPDLKNVSEVEEYMIDSSIALGGLLTDGVGNSIEVTAFPTNVEQSHNQKVQLAFNILQAAGARSSKAEFIACPSCGRTLFNLQETTERIKSKTGHLVGVKIAVMGCIVNGLGELADADFGYMGGAPGKVNLFVGKECVEKGVATEQAVDRLIDIIKQHGRWIEPETE